MLWINFLHFYQPANADAHIIKEATEESYMRIIRALEEHPNIKFTFNITGCLVSRWEELGYFDLIKRIKKLIKKKQIEIVGTASYHPILPLITEKEAVWQIKDQEKILKKYFGIKKPAGFFPPEMAYSPKIGKLIKKLGYKWIILDEIAYNGKLNKANLSKIYKDKTNGLKIIFRSRKLSKSYVPETVLKLLKRPRGYWGWGDCLPLDKGGWGDCLPLDKGGWGDLIITATDAELYGLRHIDHTAEFEKLLKQPHLKTLTISEFIKKKSNGENVTPLLAKEGLGEVPRQAAKEIKPRSCSWESTEKELKNNLPFALWQDKKNKIQQKLWQLTDLVYRTIERHKKDKNYCWARWHLVRGLASCTYWWASAKDFRLFGPISWSPDEIERGANELIRSIRALDNEKTRKDKIKAEKLYIKIKQMVWHRHWNYYWKKR
jgi:alpha-amylase/alpha-mannosidase (GH57 family)